jgi:hypothetical protein
LLERALWELPDGHRDQVTVATKFGQTKRESGGNGVDGRPEYVQAACEASLKRLGLDVTDLYYVHRIDPEVPSEDTVDAMARLIEQGNACDRPVRGQPGDDPAGAQSASARRVANRICFPFCSKREVPCSNLTLPCSRCSSRLR